MDRADIEHQVEQAHLLVVRGRRREALALIARIDADHPGNPDVGRMIADLETSLAKQRAERRAYRGEISRIRRRWMRFVGIGCLLVAYGLFRTAQGSRFGPVVTAGPVVLGLRLIYWRLLFISLLALAGATILLISAWVDPDWGNFDRP